MVEMGNRLDQGRPRVDPPLPSLNPPLPSLNRIQMSVSSSPSLLHSLPPRLPFEGVPLVPVSAARAHAFQALSLSRSRLPLGCLSDGSLTVSLGISPRPARFSLALRPLGRGVGARLPPAWSPLGRDCSELGIIAPRSPRINPRETPALPHPFFIRSALSPFKHRCRGTLYLPPGWMRLRRWSCHCPLSTRRCSRFCWRGVARLLTCQVSHVQRTHRSS